MKFTKKELWRLWRIIEKNELFSVEANTNDKDIDLINKITKNLEDLS